MNFALDKSKSSTTFSNDIILKCDSFLNIYNVFYFEIIGPRSQLIKSSWLVICSNKKIQYSADLLLLWYHDDWVFLMMRACDLHMLPLMSQAVSADVQSANTDLYCGVATFNPRGMEKRFHLHNTIS